MDECILMQSDTDLASWFQDKSSTASVCPSTGSAAAPCYFLEEQTETVNYQLSLNLY